MQLFPHIYQLICITRKSTQTVQTYARPTSWILTDLPCNFVAFVSNGLRDIRIHVYMDHDIDLLGSRDVMGHATIWYPKSPAAISYRCSIVTESVSPAIFKVMGQSISRPWSFNVTWRHRSRDHPIRHMPFPSGGLLELSLYL